MFTGYYDTALVFLSCIVAVLASYIALDMSGRVKATSENNTLWWLIGGAVAMGIGIWSMHFIGMLAFRLPVPPGYDLGITLASLLIAIVASGFALWRICQVKLSISELAVSACIMGTAIAAMHYTGMAAMRITPSIVYDPSLLALSIVIAVLASGTALWIAFQLGHATRRVKSWRALASVGIGAAIVSMHYTGMAAANFPVNSICSAAMDGVRSGWLFVVVITVTLTVLAIAQLTSVLDAARLETQTAILAHSLEESTKELRQQALHDGLTQLPNRTLLEGRLEQLLAKAKREPIRFAVMLLDLDSFKSINDSLGHHVGDLLLVEVSKRMRASIRSKDIVGRLGGDKFILVLEVNDIEDVAPFADKLVWSVGQPFVINGHELRISASIGIAMYPEDGVTQHSLRIHANAAVYHTKDFGRNGYHFFDPSMNINVQNQLQLLQDLRMALDRREFQIYYQTKVDAPTGQVIGAEALLRWNHPTRGLVAPDEFIPLAEKSGLIVEIGEWVLDEACRKMRQWYDSGKKHWTVAVNLSTVQFKNNHLVALVEAVLARHHLPPSCLILEVTESTAMQSVDTSLLILNDLVALGVNISIDDFGTGYSSLLYLKRFPACELKIDRGFIRELERDTDDAAIVAAIVSMGHTLNLSIVAEGVETLEQQQFLTSIGCDFLQGYLIGRPMPAEEFEAANDLIKTTKNVTN